MNRYEIEPEYQIEKGCSCWEYTGRWLVVDTQSDAEDLVFETEIEAKEWVESKK